jgi:cyclic peptide transporter
MNILSVVRKKGKGFYILVLGLGAINSLLNGGLLMFINQLITGKKIDWLPINSWVVYFGMVVTALIVNKAFQRNIIKLTHDIIYDFELHVIDRLRKSNYIDYQKLGKEKVHTALTDTRTLSFLPGVVVGTFNSVIIILCCLVYFYYIYFWGGVALSLVMVMLLLIYLKRNKHIKKYMDRARDAQDSFYVLLDDLLKGFREVKMSFEKNRNIYNEYIYKNRMEGKKLSTIAAVRFLNNEITGRFSWYIILGVILFAFPVFINLSPAETATFVVTLLFMMGPVDLILSSVSYYNNARIATQRLTDFEKAIQSLEEEPTGSELKRVGEIKELAFEEVTYTYYDENGKARFTLGPINLSISIGEVIFVIGGNGSGKSTFMNLLTGLIRPESGRILMNGEEITEEKSVLYRSRMTGIFTSPHLFSRNYEDYKLSHQNPRLHELMELMKLEDKLVVADNHIDTYLSKGQQKRLSLIHALLEDRSLYILDEWAAEQDPEFRYHFYNQCIQYFRDLGKTLVAITHDDAYFRNADRIIKFDFGKVVYDLPSDKVKRLGVTEEAVR